MRNTRRTAFAALAFIASADGRQICDSRRTTQINHLCEQLLAGQNGTVKLESEQNYGNQYQFVDQGRIEQAATRKVMLADIGKRKSQRLSAWPWLIQFRKNFGKLFKFQRN